jgi:hypothetical protein
MNLRPIVLVSMAVVAAGTAFSYTLPSPRRTWDSPPTFIVDSRGQASVTDADRGVTRVINAIVSSASWNGAGAGTVVRAVRGSVASWRLGDGVPMINFRDPAGVCTGSCLASTFTSFTTRADGTRRITDADIVTNAAVAWTSTSEPGGCAGEYYLESVMVREVGKALGLGSSSVAGATMNPSTIVLCSNAAATIAADDRAAINDLY